MEVKKLYGYELHSCEGRSVNWSRKRGAKRRWIYEVRLGVGVERMLFDKVVKTIRQAPGFIKLNWSTDAKLGIIRFCLKQQATNREEALDRICRALPTSVVATSGNVDSSPTRVPKKSHKKTRRHDRRPQRATRPVTATSR